MYTILPPHLTDRLARSDSSFAETVRYDAGMRQTRALLPSQSTYGDIEVYDAARRYVRMPPRTVADPALEQALRLETWSRMTAEALQTPDIPDGVIRYGARYSNAFFDGSWLVFGEGDGEVFGDFTMSLDVFAHEYGHKLVKMGPDLVYEGQPGALNESMSDVIGVCVRSFHAAEGVETNWKIGEDLFVEPGSALRDMKSPGSAYDNRLLGSDPQVGHMKDYVHTYQDHGGVHINSGIPNKAFTVFAESVPGPMHDIPLQVWRATLAMSGPRTDFGLFARASVVAAGIYGEQARAAWASVGIDA